MLREVINAVFVTYLASEWLADSDGGPSRRGAATAARAGACVAAANGFLWLSAADDAAVAAFVQIASLPAIVAAVEAALVAAVAIGLARRAGARTAPAAACVLLASSWAACLALGGRAKPHAPAVLLAGAFFVGGLYCDVSRAAAVDGPAFARALASAALYVAPCYPLLAVAISLVFLLLIGVFEKIGLPLDLLDAPIYYGCLYGPFAAVYVDAKRSLLARRRALPTTAASASGSAGAAALRRQAAQACAEPW